MNTKYYLTATHYGVARLAEAHKDRPVQLKSLVVGDANNTPYSPSDRRNATELVNERASVPIQTLDVIDKTIRVTATLNAQIGGFNIHEIGLKDIDNKIVYLGNYHGGYKSAISEGAGGELTIVVDIQTEATDRITIKIDPNVTTANKAWVEDNLTKNKAWVEERFNNLESSLEGFKEKILKSIQDIPVGGIFLTMNHFANSEAVAMHKGYGRWERLGNGQALVTLGDDTRPEFMRTIGHSGGEDMHQLTVDELPEHYHKYNGDDQYANKNIFGDDAAIKERDISYDAISDFSSSVGGVYRTSTTGKTQLHNNIQQSLTVGAWKRLPDFDSVFTLTSNKNKVFANDDIIFTLTTQHEPKGAQYYFDVDGLDPESYSLSSNSFATDENFTAQVRIHIKNLNTQFHNRELALFLRNGKGAIGIEKDIPPVKYTRLFLDQLPTIKTEEDVIQVKDSVNLYRFFVQKEKRKPIPNENITFVIPENIAIIGTTPLISAIEISDFTTQIITIENNGFILGRGANTGKPTTSAASDKRTTGGTAIKNTTDITVQIFNKNQIAGGGGAGGIGMGYRSVPCGAPYGIPSYKQSNYEQAKATFRKGGAKIQSSVTDFSMGKGGDWGEDGENGYNSIIVGDKSTYDGTKAGIVFSGKFNIVENTGTIKGTGV